MYLKALAIFGCMYTTALLICLCDSPVVFHRNSTLGSSMSAALVRCTLIAITSAALIAPAISTECNENLRQAERGTLWEGDVVVDDQLKLMYGCHDNDEDYSLRQDESKGAHRSKDERSSVQVVEAESQAWFC